MGDRVSVDMDDVERQLTNLQRAAGKCDDVLRILNEGARGNGTDRWTSVSAMSYQSKCSELYKELKSIRDDISSLENVIRNTARDIIEKDKNRGRETAEVIQKMHDTLMDSLKGII